MGFVGSFGDVAFEVNTDRIFTWNDCVRDRKTEYAEHKVLDGKAHLQLLGQGLDEFSLAITLDCNWCAPEREMQKLDAMQEDGKAYRLILGGRIFGAFVLESQMQNRARTDGQGRVMVAHVQLKLKEYN